MREIKFRGFHSDIKKMLDAVDLNTMCKLNCGYGLSDDLILMQYTGLKDKNGVEIYEGDIVIISYSETQNEFPMIVEYEEEDGAYRLNDYRGTKRLHYQLPLNVQYELIWEVIGNIYENPELLEQQ